MLRIFLFVLFGIISNNAFANIKGKSLICDKDSRGYNFISKDKVVISIINFDEQIIFPVNHSYELSENAIFIQQPINVLKQEKKTKPIGWIFRRSLDYVSLDYVNGDWKRKFLWSCELTSPDQMDKRLKNKIDKLIKSSGNKIKELN